MHASNVSPEATEEGIQLVEELLRTWSSRVSAGGEDGEDTVMLDQDELSPEAQLAELKHCFAQYQSRLDQNPWIQQLIASL